MSVVSHFLKPQFAAKRFEVSIIRMRQSLREIHSAAAAEPDFSLLRNQSLAQSGERRRKFNGRAWLRAARERQLLVHHRQYPATGRLNRDHGSIHVAQSIN